MSPSHEPRRTCGEPGAWPTGTPGSGSGPRKRTGRKTATAPRADFARPPAATRSPDHRTPTPGRSAPADATQPSTPGAPRPAPPPRPSTPSSHPERRGNSSVRVRSQDHRPPIGPPFIHRHRYPATICYQQPPQQSPEPEGETGQHGEWLQARSPRRRRAMPHLRGCSRAGPHRSVTAAAEPAPRSERASVTCRGPAGTSGPGCVTSVQQCTANDRSLAFLHLGS